MTEVIMALPQAEQVDDDDKKAHCAWSLTNTRQHSGLGEGAGPPDHLPQGWECATRSPATKMGM